MTAPVRALSGTEVSPPLVVPYRHGLLSAASIVEGGDKRWEIAGVVYLAEGCEPGGGVWLDPCYQDPNPPAERPEKNVPIGLDFVSGFPFTVYEAVACQAVGFPEAAVHAERRLLMHEQFWVEQHFAATELRTADVVTLGTAVAPFQQAIGVLEQEIAARYGGEGVLHASRVWGETALSEYPDVSADPLHTKLGNVWSFGAGYGTAGPDGTEPAAGTSWLFATGPVVARRSEVQIRESFSPSRNVRMAVAERSYVITADCLRLATRAQVPGSP